MVSWTSSYLNDLPRSDFDIGLLVPYLAVLIPLGAVAIVVRTRFGHSARRLAVATGLVAPLLFLYAIVRSGASLFKVLDAGAYLTLVCSLALVATAAGVRRPRMLAPGLAGLVVLAFAIPVVAQGRVTSPVFAAYAADRTSLVAPEAAHQRATKAVETAVAPADTTTTTIVLTTSDATATAATTTTTRATTTAVVPTGGCPSKGPSSGVDRFAWEQQGGSDSWTVDVQGTVVNGTGAVMDISSVEVAVLRDDVEVSRLRVDAGRTVGSGQTMQFFRNGETVQSSGAPTSAVVVSVLYTWHDAAQASCPRR
jgi:hypothetical protein